MFKNYSIFLKYNEFDIDISIREYTGIRYKTIDFKMGYNGQLIILFDKYISKYNINKLIKKRITFITTVELNNTDKSLEMFEEGFDG